MKLLPHHVCFILLWDMDCHNLVTKLFVASSDRKTTEGRREIHSKFLTYVASSDNEECSYYFVPKYYFNSD